MYWQKGWVKLVPVWTVTYAVFYTDNICNSYIFWVVYYYTALQHFHNNLTPTFLDHRQKEKINWNTKNKSKCTFRVVFRYYEWDSLPSAMLGAQRGRHDGSGCSKIVALLRILVSLAGHGSLGEKIMMCFFTHPNTYMHTKTHTEMQKSQRLCHRVGTKKKRGKDTV